MVKRVRSAVRILVLGLGSIVNKLGTLGQLVPHPSFLMCEAGEITVTPVKDAVGMK